FQWTPCEDPVIQAVISDEYFQNPNAWHVKVALVNYTTVEMHQLDRNRSSFQSYRACWNTCYGLGSMASRIYCRQRRDSGN
ncbi:hypothetical protein Goshw_013050, partial [Gossypium schwendimanii]|nr:hypothetical protein [Gossypium schwendimanii]